MAREKMFDPAFQKAFAEAIYKENKTRSQWHSKYRDRVQRVLGSSSWDDEPDDDDDDFAASQDLAPPPDTGTKDTSPSGSGKHHIPPDDPGDPAKVEPLPVMKPVPPDTMKLLYKGLSHHDEGRACYLKNRYKDRPENKFYFPVCSSWEYGWTYGQEHELEFPDHGRTQIMKTSFFRTNDPQLKPID